jgi:hypothetical protein
MNNAYNTPDPETWGSRLTPLPRPTSSWAAQQAREMGLVVGDTIVGREGNEITGWWQEQRLTLLFIGEQLCVWRSEWRNHSSQVFREPTEQSAWSLKDRSWYLVKQDENGIMRENQKSLQFIRKPSKRRAAEDRRLVQKILHESSAGDYSPEINPHPPDTLRHERFERWYRKELDAFKIRDWHFRDLCEVYGYEPISKQTNEI